MPDEDSFPYIRCFLIGKRIYYKLTIQESGNSAIAGMGRNGNGKENWYWESGL